VQKQAKEIETLTAQAKRKDDQIASQQKQIDALKKRTPKSMRLPSV